MATIARNCAITAAPSANASANGKAPGGVSFLLVLIREILILYSPHPARSRHFRMARRYANQGDSPPISRSLRYAATPRAPRHPAIAMSHVDRRRAKQSNDHRPRQHQPQLAHNGRFRRSPLAADPHRSRDRRQTIRPCQPNVGLDPRLARGRAANTHFPKERYTGTTPATATIGGCFHRHESASSAISTTNRGPAALRKATGKSAGNSPSSTSPSSAGGVACQSNLRKGAGRMHRGPARPDCACAPPPHRPLRVAGVRLRQPDRRALSHRDQKAIYGRVLSKESVVGSYQPAQASRTAASVVSVFAGAGSASKFHRTAGPTNKYLFIRGRSCKSVGVHNSKMSSTPRKNQRRARMTTSTLRLRSRGSSCPNAVSPRPRVLAQYLEAIIDALGG